MNSTPIGCPTDDELGTIHDLPATDPRRLHVESCTRCRATLASYGSFVDAAVVAEPLLPGEAEHLAALRARLSNEPVVEAPRRTESAPARTRPIDLWGWLAPSRRPVLAFATVVIVAGAMLMWPGSPFRDPERAVRGPVGHSPRAAQADMLGNGDVRFTWPSQVGADRYEVQIHSTALGMLAQFEAGPDTVLVVPVAELPPAYRDGDVVLFRIVAFAGGDRVSPGVARPLQRGTTSR